MTKKIFKKTMEFKSATIGILSFFEKIIRGHPLVYIFIRSIVRFTNIFEKDFDGLKLLRFKEKINIIDVGASDGIASKFFSRKLHANKIICFEPNKPYVQILKKLNIKNLVIKPYGVSEFKKYYKVFFPRYKLLSKNLDLITYTYYDKKALLDQINLDFKFKKNISIVESKIYLKKIRRIKTKISLIKIDVNGHELSVIRGLSTLIESCS